MFDKAILLASFFAFAFAFAVSPVFADGQEDLENRCKQYAQEEEVPQEELDQYIADCVTDLTEESSKESE